MGELWKNRKNEVLKMVNDEFKKLLLQDDETINLVCIYLFYTINQDKSKKRREFNLNEYDFYNWYLNKEDSSEQEKNIKLELRELIKNEFNDNLADGVIDLFAELVISESKNLLYSLSRLLYLQDKHKNDQAGIQLTSKIKDIIKCINTCDESILSVDKSDIDTYTKEQTIELNKQLFAITLYHLIPNVCSDIYVSKSRKPFSMLVNEQKLDTKEAYERFKAFINNKISFGKSYSSIFNKISSIINDIFNTIQFDEFLDKHQAEFKEIVEKSKPYKNKTDTTLLKTYYLIGNTKSDDENELNEELDKFFSDPLISKLYDLFLDYKETEAFKKLESTEHDIQTWQLQADNYIKHILNKKYADFKTFDINYTIKHLAYNTEQKRAFRIKVRPIPPLTKTKTSDETIKQSTSRQLKAIDNARGGLVTYEETNTQRIKQELDEATKKLINATTPLEVKKLKAELKEKEKEYKLAQQKEKELQDEYDNITEHLTVIYKSLMDSEKNTPYYKDLNKQRKELEKKKNEIKKILKFDGWQLDIKGNGSYDFTPKPKEKLTLTISNLNKQLARYTKEEQDIFDFLLNKYLHNTNDKTVSFTLREYENRKGRVRPDKYLLNDIQAIRLLFREIWTYYTTDNKAFSFSEAHLFNTLLVSGEIESDENNLNNVSLDTTISLEVSKTLDSILKDYDGYLYISTPKNYDVIQLNNDNEYLAKRLIKYVLYLARVNKSDIVEVALDNYIEELQHYGLKRFSYLDKHKTYKTEIVDVLDKTFSIAEGDNHLGKKFIEVLDRQPFIDYDNNYLGKSQETAINEWGKQKIKVKVFGIDNTLLLDIKEKQKKQKEKTNKNNVNKKATKK